MAHNKSDSSDEIMNIDDFIPRCSSPSVLQTTPADVFPSRNLLDSITYILYNNKYEENIVTLSIFQEEIFEIIENLREYPEKMFMCLRRHFAKHFDIDLYIVAYNNSKFSLINNDNYDKEKMAFLSFNEDNTVCGPLYAITDNGTPKTVFSSDDAISHLNVYMYVTHLNGSKLSANFIQIQEQQADNCAQELIENSLPDNIPATANQVDPFDDKTQSRMVLQQMLQQMFRIIDGLPIDPRISREVLQQFVSHVAAFEHLSPQDTITASKDGIYCLSCLVQLAEQPIYIHQNEQVAMPQLTVSNDINNQNVGIQYETNQTTPDVETSLPNNGSTATTDIIDLPIEELTHIDEKYDPPIFSKPLESTFRPCTFKEFSQTGSAPLRCVDSSQRGSLEIQVPPNDATSLYLVTELVDLNNETHVSKFIVPDKTKAENESLINNNDLRCLNFSKCNKDYKFNHETKRLYSKITQPERQDLKKSIRIHLINLYQRRQVTRRMVQEQNLKKCKLAMWFCTLENGKYKRVSPKFYSNVIEERPKSTNKEKKIIIKNPKRLSKPPFKKH